MKKAGEAMMGAWEALVAHHPALAAIPPALREVASLQTFAAGEAIFRQGERPKAMFRILSGEIRLTRRSADGNEIVLQRGREGFLAEASMTSSRYHCDAVAAESGRLVRFPLRAFIAALGGDPDFRDAWIAHLAREVRALRAQNERLSLRGAAERILHYLEAEGGGVTLRQSRKAWAAELGLSHEALYRTLKRLCQEGVIADEGRRIVLLRPPQAAQRHGGQGAACERGAGGERV